MRQSFHHALQVLYQGQLLLILSPRDQRSQQVVYYTAPGKQDHQQTTSETPSADMLERLSPNASSRLLECQCFSLHIFLPTWSAEK